VPFAAFVGACCAWSNLARSAVTIRSALKSGHIGRKRFDEIVDPIKHGPHGFAEAASLVNKPQS
jgi:hypothetical protein